MNTIEKLEAVKQKAQQDPALMEKLLDTRKEPDSLEAFCRICREVGCEIYEMEVINSGEEFYASMRRSTNGGGENSPKLAGEDDFYELFLAELRDGK